MYQLNEIDGVAHADTINLFNKLVPEWPPLQPRHYTDGYWFVAHAGTEAVAFAGLVPFEPFPNIGYMKRCYVAPEHRGKGLQQGLISLREDKAKSLGWTHVLSDCCENNLHSATNFRRSGYSVCDPEQKWETNSLYWIKTL